MAQESLGKPLSPCFAEGEEPLAAGKEHLDAGEDPFAAGKSPLVVGEGLDTHVLIN